MRALDLFDLTSESLTTRCILKESIGVAVFGEVEARFCNFTAHVFDIT